MIGGLSTWFIAAGIALVGFIATYMRGRVDGAKLQRASDAAKEAKARDVADEVENDVGALPGSKAREELGKWAR